MNSLNGKTNGKQLFELLDELDEDIVEDAWTKENRLLSKTVPKNVSENKNNRTTHFLKITASAAACAAIAAVVITGLSVVANRNSLGVDIVLPGSSVSENLTPKPKLDTNPLTLTENTIDITGGNNQKNDPIIAEKTDDYDYAALYINETNASEDEPAYISIYGCIGEDAEKTECVSETVRVTRSGVYVIKYTCPREKGTFSVLNIDTDSENLVLKGKWLP